MNELEIWILAVGLAMDCFAVSTTSGIIYKKVKWRPMLTMAFFFGLFQGLFPIFGWWGTGHFRHLIESYDHWIAFGILVFLGGRMIIDSFKEEEKKLFDPHKLSVILTMAVATSIDALAVGISFACMGDSLCEFSQLLHPVCVIGFVSFLLSLVGLFLGIHFGKKVEKRLRPDLLGGIILIIIGVKVLITHLAGLA